MINKNEESKNFECFTFSPTPPPPPEPSPFEKLCEKYRVDYHVLQGTDGKGNKFHIMLQFKRNETILFAMDFEMFPSPGSNLANVVNSEEFLKDAETLMKKYTVFKSKR